MNQPTEKPYIITLLDQGETSSYQSGGDAVRDANALAGALVAALGKVGIGTRRRIIAALRPKLKVNTPRKP